MATDPRQSAHPDERAADRSVAVVRRPRATVYTVARTAGVSISTVSLAINQPHRVADATRKRIVAAARALGYRPDGAWRARTGGRPVGIAVAAPFTSYSSYSRRMSGVLDRLRDSGIDVMIYDLEAATAAGTPLLDALPVRAGVDGILVMGVSLSTDGGSRLAEWGPPVVLLDAQEDRTPSVLMDDEQGGLLVGRHLAELGHRRVAFLRDEPRSPDTASASALRRKGLAEGLGAPERAEVVALDASAATDGGTALLAAVRDGVTAIFATHDELAALVSSGLRAAGIRVPGDVSLVGFDDGPLAAALDLTTVRQPFEESGRTAADLLLRLMADGTSVMRTTLAVKLMVRTSTARAVDLAATR
ncbi:LacI family DNA-binding transcriptional regulator [Antribacter gilvus]|uniref:LacI family DNA-binding transcriptional regulator n=1 Tax=Antribacter gilvus TaxID=2304675 RepID=UPI000F79E654|nr:LacI family DNA-binding transcriptional regulator [Antribacter gilvus]